MGRLVGLFFVWSLVSLPCYADPLDEVAREELSLPEGLGVRGREALAFDIQAEATHREDWAKDQVWSLGLSLQPYQPEGAIEISRGRGVRLDELPLRPMLGFEVSRQLFEPVASLLQLFVRAEGGLSYHSMNVTFANGYTVEDVNLFSFAGGFMGGFQTRLIGPLSFELGGGLGGLVVAQSSREPVVNRTVALIHWGLDSGLRYQIFERVWARLGYHFRSKIDGDPLLETQTHNGRLALGWLF